MQIPIRSLVVLIKGSVADAEDYAKSWLSSTQSVIGYWYVIPWYDGEVLLEIHDGGSGRAYLPGIIDEFKRQTQDVPEDRVSVGAIIPGSESALTIDLSRSGLRKLAIAPDQADESMIWPVSESMVMTRFSARPDIPVLILSVFLVTLASLSLFLSIAHRPVPYPVKMNPVVSISPWQAWNSGIADQTSGHPATVYYKHGVWSWNQSSVKAHD